MGLSKMSARDRRIIFECLTAAAKGPFFTDDDVMILFGLTRQELLSLVARIPRLDDTEPQVRRAIGHALSDLVGYTHEQHARLGEWISVSQTAVEEVANRWYQLLPPIEYSSQEVHGPVEIDGLFYRVITYTIHGGGHGIVSQVWRNEQWMIPFSGPGCSTILATAPATREALLQAGVDVSSLRAGYDPLAVVWEGPEDGENTLHEDARDGN